MRMQPGQPRRARSRARGDGGRAGGRRVGGGGVPGAAAGRQVNDDPAAGINPALSVSGEDPTNADVVGGALTAGKPAVPWAIFRQQEASGPRPGLLALVRRRRVDDARQRHGRRALQRQRRRSGAR